MKKKFLLMLTSVLLMLVCMSLPIYAAGVTSTVSSKSANRGDTVTMTASLSGSISVGSGSVSLSYDKNVLELIGGTWNVSGAMLTNFDLTKEKGAFAYSSATSISGTIFTAEFKVLNSAALGATNVSLNITLKDGSNANITVTNKSGSLTVACKHDFSKQDTSANYLKSKATCSSAAVYYKSCSICGAKGTDTFKSGSALAHTFTSKVSSTYLKTAATCTAKAVYYESCSACGTKGTKTFQSGNALGHSYKTSWSSNNTSHWHECTRCKDKKDNASHTPGAAATETKAQTCTVCSYVIKQALGHKHNYSSQWSSNASNHWYACAGCSEKKNNGSHAYDNACDATCNTCAYTRQTSHKYSTKWSQDKTKHWHQCSVCKVKVDEAKHIPGAEATETKAQTCTVCSYVIKDALGHKHSFSNTWQADEDTHWHACDCEAKVDEAAHEWDDGVITKEATVEEDGSKTVTCTICKQKKTVTIDKLASTAGSIEPAESMAPTQTPGAADPTPSAEQTDDNTAGTDNVTQSPGTTEPVAQDGNNIGWLILLILVIGCGIIVVIILLKKKKSKT